MKITKVYTQDLPAVRFIGIKYGEEDKKDGTHIWKWADWFSKNRFAPLEKLFAEGLQPIPDESGAWWRIERHVEPRFSQKDDEGKITLDLCHFIK